VNARLGRIARYLENTHAQRDALERQLRPLRERHQRAILEAEATHRAAVANIPQVHITGRRAARYYFLEPALRAYAGASIIAAADARLSAELDQADRDYREAAAPFQAQYERAVAAVGPDAPET
jgi:hypothetical protein